MSACGLFVIFVPPAKLLAWFHAKIRLDHEFSLPAKSAFNPARSNLGQQSCLNSRGFWQKQANLARVRIQLVKAPFCSEVSILTYCAKLSYRKTRRAIAFIAGFANRNLRS
jgi:hypothetical protein